MPIKVVLEGERCDRQDQVLDPYADLAQLWPTGDQAFPLLQYIDPYGHTIFNGMLMRQVLRELELLAQKTDHEAAKNLFKNIKKLAVRCRDANHLYLRFVGD
jgi:hypothetical protein